MTDTRSRRLLPLLTPPSEPSQSLKRSANSPHAVAKAYRAHTQGHRVLKPSVCACVALRKAFRAYTFRYACAVYARCACAPGPCTEGPSKGAEPKLGRMSIVVDLFSVSDIVCLPGDGTGLRPRRVFLALVGLRRVSAPSSHCTFRHLAWNVCDRRARTVADGAGRESVRRATSGDARYL